MLQVNLSSKNLMQLPPYASFLSKQISHKSIASTDLLVEVTVYTVS